MIDEEQFSGPTDQHWVEICDTTGTAIASLQFVRVATLN
jgi:hypothetical protein